MNDNFIFNPYRINISAIVPTSKFSDDVKSIPITKEENSKFIYSVKDLKFKNKKIKYKSK